ncbi:ABC transporter permease subunit [Caballeronia fortuita]|uniref:ABC transporter permease subunit n=1 Tax=Caballeronia fortuita TaxID=1777138 RepID=UPI001FC95D26|nr:hypothetical protein [Caballeronia fortuita]
MDSTVDVLKAPRFSVGILRQLIPDQVRLTDIHAAAPIDDVRFAALDNGTFLGIATPIWVLVVLPVVNHFVLAKTVFGRKAYFAGGNREAALYSGINVRRLRIVPVEIMATERGQSLCTAAGLNVPSSTRQHWTVRPAPGRRYGSSS